MKFTYPLNWATIITIIKPPSSIYPNPKIQKPIYQKEWGTAVKVREIKPTDQTTRSTVKLAAKLGEWQSTMKLDREIKPTDQTTRLTMKLAVKLGEWQSTVKLDREIEPSGLKLELEIDASSDLWDERKKVRREKKRVDLREKQRRERNKY